MVGSSKILTVSYGTFSCTLEGFEDSFSTMKAIAEYFRDLAADDRYFGAEPPTPDADMLARIAEREVARRVEARSDGASIVLRTGTALTRGDAAPAAEADAGSADQAAAPETTPVAQTKAAPAPSAEPAPVAVATAVAVAAAADAAMTAAQHTDNAATARAAAPAMPPAVDAPAAQLPATQPSPAPVVPTRPAAHMPTPRVTERPALPAHPDAESVAAKLQRIRAVVGRAAPQAAAAPLAAAPLVSFAEDESEDSPDDSLSDVLGAALAAPMTDDLAETETTAEAAPMRTAAPGRIEARVIKMRRADFEAAVSAGQFVDDSADTSATDSQTAQAAAAATLGDDANSSLSAEDEAALQAELAALEDEGGSGAAQDVLFDEDDQDDMEGAGDADENDTAVDDESHFDADADDEMDADSGDQIDFEDETDFDRAIHSARATDQSDDDLDGDDAFDSDSDASNDADLADRDLDIDRDNDREAAALAAIANTIAGAAALDTATLTDPAEADADDAPAGQKATITEGAAAALASVRGLMGLGSKGSATDTDDTSNVMSGSDDDDEDDTEDAGENLFAGDDGDDEDDFETNTDASKDVTASDKDVSAPAAQTPLRPRRVTLPDADEDEDDVVARIADQTEARMVDPESRNRRDAIHQLKAAVAATEAERRLSNAKDEASAEQGNESAFRDDLAQVVRPRRPVLDDVRTERPRPAPLKLVASQRIDGDAASRHAPTEGATPVRPRRVSVTEVPSTPGPKGSGFAAFAEEMGAHDLPDLLEAAAAYTAFIEGSEDFSRPQLMSRVQELREEPFSREDGLRSFGALLRQGRILKVRNGRFAVSGDSRFNPERRAG